MKTAGKKQSEAAKGKSNEASTCTSQQTVEQRKNLAKSWPCLYCEGPKHAIADCRKFSSLKVTERSEHCKKKGLCFGCLNPGHMKKGCPNKDWSKCSKCPRQHPTALHDDERDKKTNFKETPVTVTSGMANKHGGPFMTIIPVQMKAKVGSQHVKTYAFIDNGCATVFASKELTNILNVRKTKVKLFVKTITGEDTVETQTVQDTLQVGDVDGNTFLDLPEVYVRDVIPISSDDIPTEQDLKKWSHLSQVKLPELQTDCQEDVVCIPRG